MLPRKKILILFNGPHLAYSPTTLQLHDALSEEYDVTVIAQQSGDYNQHNAPVPKAIFHPYYGVKSRKWYSLRFFLQSLIPGRARLFKQRGLTYRDYFFKYLFIKKHLEANHYFRIVANDHVPLFLCTQLNLPCDFLSLELTQDEALLPFVNHQLIQSVIIQSQDRYDYLFKDQTIPIFFVQNAPVFKPFLPTAERKNLIYAGAANDEFGFFHCLDFLVANPDEHLTLQGSLLAANEAIVRGRYQKLLDGGQLTINKGYLDNEAMAIYLRQFEMGLCFYNFDNEFIKARHFNYTTAPSGKLFKYLAAGLPVVASNIPAFRFVEEEQCGVLVDDLQPATLKAAVEKVRAHQQLFSSNALRMAAHFSFDQRVAPYLAFLKMDTDDRKRYYA